MLLRFFSEKSSTKESIIISNFINFLWYFWKFYLFFLLNIVFDEYTSGFFYIRNSYASIFALVSSWGISSFSSRVISHTFFSKTRKMGYVYKKLLYLIFFPLIIFIPFIIAISILNLISYVDQLMLSIFFYLLTQGIFLTFSAFYEGVKNFRIPLIFTIMKILIDTFLISLVLVGKNIYDLLLICAFLDLILILSMMFLFRKKIEIIHKNYFILKDKENISGEVKFSQHLKDVALPIALLTILGIVSEQLSRLYVGLFISVSILTSYIFAESIILSIGRISNGVSSGLLPRLTEIDSKGNENKIKNLITKVWIYNQLILCIGILFLFVFYYPLANIIFDVNFSKISTEIVKLLSISLIFISVSGSFLAFFISIGKPKYTLFSQITSIILNIIILFSAGSYIGLLAVIIGFIVSRSLIFCLTITIYLISKRKKRFLKNLFLIILYGVLFYIFLVIFSIFNGIFNLPLILRNIMIFIFGVSILFFLFLIFQRYDKHFKLVYRDIKKIIKRYFTK